MRIALERRAERQRRRERLEFVTSAIKEQSLGLQIAAHEHAGKSQDKYDYAATLINAGARGYFGRLLGQEQRLQTLGALKIQCAYRGMLGRMRAEEERWRKVRVAPTKYALNIVRLRSKVIMDRGDWLELLDPFTNTFWYLNRRNTHSTWTPPPEFEQDLFCMWDPWPHPYESLSDSNQPCRMVFKTVDQYQNHRRHAHNWICPACEVKNSSLLFPQCGVCANRLDRASGEDLTKTLDRRFRQVYADFKRPPATIVEEGDAWRSADEDSYLELEQADHIDAELELSGWDAKHDPGVSSESLVRDDGGATASPEQEEPSFGDGTALTAAISADGEGGTVPFGALASAPASGAPDRLSTGPGMATPPDGDRAAAVVGLGAATAGAAAALEGCGGEVFPASNAGCATAVGSAVPGDSLAASRGSEDDVYGVDEVVPTRPTPEMMRVCNRFLRGWCTKTTCAMAHPGLRDSAEPVVLSGSGARKKYGVVVCRVARECGDWNRCLEGNKCKCYHPYLRPATLDIVRKLYPMRRGRAVKEYRGGAKIDGMMDEDEHGEANYNGYGIFTWPNGDTYMGDWARGIRSGRGIFRSASGKEYVGHWQGGLRHGWGVLTHANGEVYEGEFRFGAADGLGHLRSANGDTYNGQFERNRFHGMGRYRKSNGDTYLGYCVRGKAGGMGVLAFASGEKYKGTFKDDKRSGKGACIYPNGCRYVGSWDGGWHQGFGVFLTPSGERYVGNWNKNKKHGKGRYLFSGGDFYDGEFNADKAEGEGIYRYAATGNVFAGSFSGDKKNGRGVYVWQSGSRYDGCWANNDIDGKGVFIFANYAVYKGEFSHNKKHGRGIFTWKTGNVYKGEFADDKMCGIGEMKYNTTNHRHVGMWAGNKKNGKGTFWYADGNIYDGEFRNDLKHGYGKLVYRPNTLVEESYEGMYDRGVRHGHGIYKYKQQEGIIYEGSWHRGLRHGKGTLRWSDGRFYRGDFIRERMTGRGLMVWPDGSQYEGEWKDNERHGEGTFLGSNGAIYQGRFVHGVKQGPGVLTYIDGNSYVGEWENDNIKGVGTFNFIPSEDPGEKVVHLKVFGF